MRWRIDGCISMTSRYAHVLPQVMTDAAERIGWALWGET
jgi:hypothetical protein